jgi:hypothetical protein
MFSLAKPIALLQTCFELQPERGEGEDCCTSTIPVQDAQKLVAHFCELCRWKRVLGLYILCVSKEMNLRQAHQQQDYGMWLLRPRIERTDIKWNSYLLSVVL